MEAKLKTLKVPELKDILSRAQQPPPAKAAKSDLISRIIASKEATQIYNQKYGPKDDLLAPPEDLDWDVDQVNAPETPVEQPAANPPAAKPPVATPAPTTKPESPTAKPSAEKPTVAAAATTPASEDAEAEKRRKRAERFGVPLVEARPPVVKKTAVAAAVAAAAKQPDVPEKLNARAERFGTGKKRTLPVEEVDAEELERRRKRAERFGTGPKS
ncbi:hypothetical protein C8R43DRAFT_1133443 [Mycena crocata]|nr:hypothetical protein C8R43DRAFT_1133443 [Mycena crocata]